MKPTPSCSEIDSEFDRLRTFGEITLNADLLAFVQKAHASIQLRGHFEERDCHKRSLLHYAAIGNCINLLQRLLEEKPYVDSRDHSGRTPFSWAAEYGSLDVAEILLEQGAKINALDYSGGLPLTWLIHAGNPRTTNLETTEAWLRHRGAKKKQIQIHQVGPGSWF
jgi:ankyrin repeat protein